MLFVGKKIIINAEHIQALVVAVGTVVAGIWTYLLFVRKRLHYPKVNTHIEISKIDIAGKKRFIRVDINIENIGSVLLKSNYAELRLRQIEPIRKDILEVVKKGYDPLFKSKSKIEWPCIVQREWKDQFKLEIEPGEKDALQADFFIDDDISTIELYFFLQNQKKVKGIGWTLTKMQTFLKEDTVTGFNNQFHGDQQERQQPQEQKQQQQQPVQTQEQQPPPQQQQSGDDN